MTIYLDVSNTFRTRKYTGIQRVVREFARRLAPRPGYALLVVDAGRLALLDPEHELPRLLAGEAFRPRQQVELDHFGAGDVLVDIDASWGEPHASAALWRALKQRHCQVVKFLHDAIPVLFPQFSHPDTRWRFLENFTAATALADHWICTTATVAGDLAKIFAEDGLGQPLTAICGLGADLPEGLRPQAPAQTLPPRFMLAVGTIEPRKNHDFVLDLCEQLWREPAHADTALVLVGRAGWNNEDILARLRSHAELGRRLFWLDGASDAELLWLYQHTALSLCLSHYEGFGLPVIEALAHGAPVLCTADSAMAEVARGHALTTVLAPEPALAALRAALAPTAPTSSSTADPDERFEVPAWDSAAATLANHLEALGKRTDFARPLRQAVYISLRPRKLLRSLRSLAQHMSFIEEVVVLCPDSQLAAMRALASTLTSETRLRLQVIGEGELGLHSLPADHAERNTLLRQRLYEQPLIDDNFIACDDDCVVSATVARSDFQQGDRHLAYWFFEDGQRWPGALHAPTSFDVTIWKTSSFLAAGGYATRLYNAHQPQIINKRLAGEVFTRTQGLGGDEWSSYFNMGKLLRPGAFIDAPYRCAGWPALRERWLPDVLPSDILFYNDPEAEPALARQQAQWEAATSKALALRAAITPALPELRVSAEGAAFVPARISCPPGCRFNILILSSCEDFSLRYDFAGQDINRGYEVGNFIPLDIAADASGTLRLSAQLGLGGAQHQASLELLVS